MSNPLNNNNMFFNMNYQQQNSNNNIFNSENKQKINKMKNFLNSSNNPNQAMEMFLQQNQQLKSALDFLGNGSPEQLVRMKCQSMGISVDQLLDFISKS